MATRRRTYLVLGIALAIAIVSALAILLGGGAGGSGRTLGPPAGADQVVGVVFKVDSAGLTDVRSFTIRTTSGADVEFSLDRLENGSVFPPGHLVEHQAQSTPIRVWFQEEGGVNHALYLEDAEPGA